MSQASETDLLPCEVMRILSLRDSAAVVLSAEEKRFLIFVGPYEAEAIRREIREVRVERPLTHDVITYLMTGFDIEVKKVVISAIVGNIFCATLALMQSRDGESDAKNEVRLDIRASDAMILALKTKNQIWLSRSVYDSVEDLTDVLDDIDRQFRDAPGGADDPGFA